MLLIDDYDNFKTILNQTKVPPFPEAIAFPQLLLRPPRIILDNVLF